MNYFYVLQSSQDNQYYYGSTDELKRRFQQHQAGQVNSTKHRLPVKIVYYEAYVSLDAARRREQQVKKSGSVRTSLAKRIMGQ